MTTTAKHRTNMKTTNTNKQARINSTELRRAPTPLFILFRFTTVPFNQTLPLFGPKVYRHDDYSDQINYLREPTRTTTVGMDAGAGRFMNYTRKEFKMNPW